MIKSLQRFKLNMANAVVNRENSSMSTMDTAQLLDLFQYSAKKSSLNDSAMAAGNLNVLDGESRKSQKPSSIKSVLDSLEDVWDESQYDSLSLGSFLESLDGNTGN